MALVRSLLPIALLLAACDKPAPPPAPVPMERARPFVPAESPLLNELEDDEPAVGIARTGDLAYLLRTVRPLEWKAKMGDHVGHRAGMTVELKLAPEGAHLFAWEADLGPEVQVPATSWICDGIARDPAVPSAAKLQTCAQTLAVNRLADGALVAHVPCSVGPCPVALVRNGRVSTLPVEGLVTFYVTGSGTARPLAFAMVRWVRAEGTWSGGSLVPLRIEQDRLAPLPAVTLDEVDARDAAKVAHRIVKLAPIVKDGVMVGARLTGDRREVARDDARELAKSAIDETVSFER